MDIFINKFRRKFNGIKFYKSTCGLYKPISANSSADASAEAGAEEEQCYSKLQHSEQ